MKGLWVPFDMSTVFTLAYTREEPHEGKSVSSDVLGAVQRRRRRGQQPREYAIVDLGFFPGGGFAEAVDVNNRGQIVGWGSTATGVVHGILWDNGEVLDLGTLGGSWSGLGHQ